MSTTLLCTDGSELSLNAIRQGLALLQPADRTVLATVAHAADPSLVTGTGFAGGVMTVEDRKLLMDREREEAQRIVEEAAAALGFGEDDVETMVTLGEAGHEICRLVDWLPADVVVIGTHGRGGIKRAVMGSTSDHVVRHASCPVLVQGKVE